MGDYEQLLEPVRAIAQQAGDEILRIYEAGFSVETKADQTPVTEADYAAHDIIAKGLAELTPGIPVLSEEDDIPDFSQRRQWSRYWLVDPLDGTREFISRSGQFTVNIALIENQKAVLGVIDVPVRQCSYYAAEGGASYRREVGGPRHMIEAQRWQGKTLRIACSRSHRSPRCEDFAKQFDHFELIPLGSSLKSCYVAEGRADIYLRMGPTSEWDTAAAQVIVEQAGGVLVDLDMQPLRYNTKESLLNPHFMSVGDARHDWREFLLEGV